MTVNVYVLGHKLIKNTGIKIILKILKVQLKIISKVSKGLDPCRFVCILFHHHFLTLSIRRDKVSSNMVIFICLNLGNPQVLKKINHLRIPSVLIDSCPDKQSG